MAVYNPQHPDTLQRQLQHADTHLLVVCFCAAWCDTCNAYESDFQTLAQQRPSATFIWVDIEEHPELLGGYEVENFPTIMLQTREHTLFFGELPPQISHLERMVQALENNPSALRPVSGPALLTDTFAG